jgi:hypothetical protein
MRDDGQPANPAEGFRFGATLEPVVRFLAPMCYAGAVPLLHRVQPLAPLLLVCIRAPNVGRVPRPPRSVALPTPCGSERVSEISGENWRTIL